MRIRTADLYSCWHSSRHLCSIRLSIDRLHEEQIRELITYRSSTSTPSLIVTRLAILDRHCVHLSTVRSFFFSPFCGLQYLHFLGLPADICIHFCEPSIWLQLLICFSAPKIPRSQLTSNISKVYSIRSGARTVTTPHTRLVSVSNRQSADTRNSSGTGFCSASVLHRSRTIRSEVFLFFSFAFDVHFPFTFTKMPNTSSSRNWLDKVVINSKILCTFTVCSSRCTRQICTYSDAGYSHWSHITLVR